MNSRLAVALLAIFLMITSCSKKFHSLYRSAEDKNELNIDQIDFDYFSGKAKINYKDVDLDIKARANVRIKKDSAIWIAFSAVGIQGARCMISRDSITIINMMKKEYYVFDYASLSQQFNFNVSFDAIQAAALGNLIKTKEKHEVVDKNEEYYVLKQGSGDVFIHNYISSETMKIERVEMLESKSKNTAVVRYYDFQMVNEHVFPYSAIISLFYKANNRTLNTVIEFEYSKAEIEEKPLKFPFNIPKKYERK